MFFWFSKFSGIQALYNLSDYTIESTINDRFLFMRFLKPILETKFQIPKP